MLPTVELRCAFHTDFVRVYGESCFFCECLHHSMFWGWVKSITGVDVSRVIPCGFLGAYSQNDGSAASMGLQPGSSKIHIHGSVFAVPTDNYHWYG